MTSTQQQVDNMIARLPSLMLSRASTKSARDAMLVRIGLQALSYIRQSFIIKAKGGTDAAGDRWPALKKSTIAYSRRHPGLPIQKIRAQFRPSWMLPLEKSTPEQFDLLRQALRVKHIRKLAEAAIIRREGMSLAKLRKKLGKDRVKELIAAEKKLLQENEFRSKWWKIYGQQLARFHGDKGHAAAIAWIVVKEEGAKTIIGEYGNTPVQMLRDYGLLLNSLSPSLAPDRATDVAPIVDNQIFRLAPAAVTIGTNRVGAAAHHKGIPGKLPQRRLWPDPAKWPAAWWKGLLSQARQGIIDVVTSLLKR